MSSETIQEDNKNGVPSELSEAPPESEKPSRSRKTSRQPSPDRGNEPATTQGGNDVSPDVKPTTKRARTTKATSKSTTKPDAKTKDKSKQTTRRRNVGNDSDGENDESDNAVKTNPYAEIKSSKETAPDELKIVTWNVNGLRSVLNPNPHFGGKAPITEYVKAERPDVLFLNEIKLNDKIGNDFDDILEGYKGKTVLADKNGYAGVAVYWRLDSVTPLAIRSGIGQPEHDTDGRTVTLELPDLILVGTYVPNSGRGLVKLDYRVNDYDPAMRDWLIKQSETLMTVPEGDTAAPVRKDLIWCGDLNVAHEEIDIWNSKGNQKSAGHTPEERKSFSKLVKDEKAFFKDVYRVMYPDKVQYTYWAATSPAGYQENKGWRLDYFVASEDSFKRCKDVIIRKDIRGSDHCPVVLIMSRCK